MLDSTIKQLLKESVDKLHYALEADIHSEYYQCYQECSHHNNNRAVHQLLPCGPGNFVDQLVVCFLQVCLYVCHFLYKKISTGGEARTPDTWFWRPVLYQLSYTRV